MPGFFGFFWSLPRVGGKWQPLGIKIGGLHVLALYYSVWITSLAYTSVANASVLGALCPVFVALTSWVLFGDKLRRHCLAGIAFSLAGSGRLVSSKMEFGLESIKGDLLAVAGAFFISGYYMSGGYLRRFMTTRVYITLVYLSAAFFLWIMIKTSGISLMDDSLKDKMIMIAHGVVCSVLGHGIYNFLLGRLPPITLSLSVLAEPIFAIIFAIVLFNETLGLIQIAGIFVIMVGLLIYSLS
ncbi:MAG: DMT family transporter [Desulfobacterales bacterium]|nr:DMT family transporter [Desulfobacterales bacterium]